MNDVTGRAFARAGLLGNPSDGYNGKTISMIVRNFSARVRLQPHDAIEIAPDAGVLGPYRSVHSLVEHLNAHGFYGSERLVKAAIKRFVEYHGGELPEGPGFRVHVTSDIPRQVGLAGSSAIVIATLRALMQWYDRPIPPHLLASLALSAETELGIPAGLQDRVIQAYEGIVYMDFSRDQMRRECGLEYGVYEPLSPPELPRFYLAWLTHGAEPTEVTHRSLRQRFEAGEPDVIRAMKRFAEIASEGRSALMDGDTSRLNELIDENFDLRRSICPLNAAHVRLIEAARSVGASAKFCGSGGAIIGCCESETAFADLIEACGKAGAKVITPTIFDA